MSTVVEYRDNLSLVYSREYADPTHFVVVPRAGENVQIKQHEAGPTSTYLVLSVIVGLDQHTVITVSLKKLQYMNQLF